jgi:hypothetical protein
VIARADENPGAGQPPELLIDELDGATGCIFMLEQISGHQQDLDLLTHRQIDDGCEDGLQLLAAQPAFGLAAAQPGEGPVQVHVSQMKNLYFRHLSSPPGDELLRKGLIPCGLYVARQELISSGRMLNGLQNTFEGI